MVISPSSSPPHPSGGFLLSPPASSVYSSTSSTAASSSSTTLPRPRTSPLRAGGSKESAFIRHVDARILHIQRRFAKRTTPAGAGLSDVARDEADAWGDVRGYASMKEACRDIGDLAGVVWVSGTPSLQIPYLINLSLVLGNVISAMPPTPRALFRVLGLLDHCFASLLQGHDVETGEPLSGFGRGRAVVSGTEKVRIRSLVERTRVGVMEAFKRGEFDFDEAREDEEGVSSDVMDVDDPTEGELVLEGDDAEEEDEDDSWDMQLAKVYDRTVVELGDSLEEPSLGMITEGRG